SAGDLDRELEGTDAGSSARGKPQPDGSTLWTDFKCLVQPDANGDVVLHSLEPGVTGTIVALDALGRAAASCAFTSPEFGEILELDLLVAASPRRLAGRVIDHRGAALGNARLELRSDERETYESIRQSDDKGSFVFDGLYGDEPLQLTIVADGFLPQRHQIGPAEPRPGERVFQLAPGRTVTVRVLDDDDRPVAAAPRLLAGDALGAPGTCDQLADGEVRWRNLPTGEVTFACSIGGREFTLKHDTTEPNATLRVPTPASLDVVLLADWPQPTDHSFTVYVVVQRLDVAADPVEIWAPRPEHGKAMLLLPGRYRIRLVAQENRPPGTQRDLGLSAEVVLVAGQSAVTTLH
ncbi:MAG: carboxypeptidase-like regulatory domain-containing protein, partial [Planctomycetota bacterium]